MEKVIKLPLALEKLKNQTRLELGKKTGRQDHTHLLTEGVLLGANGNVVVVESLPQNPGGNTKLLGKSLTTVKTFHETTTDIMLAVPFNFFGSLSIENESNGEFAIFPNLARNIVAML